MTRSLFELAQWGLDVKPLVPSEVAQGRERDRRSTRAAELWDAGVVGHFALRFDLSRLLKVSQFPLPGFDSISCRWVTNPPYARGGCQLSIGTPFLYAGAPTIARSAMLQRSREASTERSIPRLLPKDDEIHYAVADCQRDLETAAGLLQSFRDRWFNADPPQHDIARITAVELADMAAKLRASVHELVCQTDPSPK